MKKKYLKKMLAIMLASMTVAATPGLVGAMKEESRNAINEINAQIANHKLTTNEATAFLDKLEEILDEDDEAKKEVSSTLGDMIDEGLFGKISDSSYYDCGSCDIPMCSAEDLARIIQIFKICSKCDCAKRNTAWSIAVIAHKGLLGKIPHRYSSCIIAQCSPKVISDVIEILENCLNYTDSSVEEADYFKTKQHVANSIYQLANRGVLGSTVESLSPEKPPKFEKCSPEEASKIMECLEKCLKGNEEVVADDIGLLASKDLLGQYSDKSKILDMLQKCLNNSEIDIREEVAEAVRVSVARNLFEKSSFESILSILKQCLSPCSKSRSYPYSINSSVAFSIFFMAKHDVFGKDSVDSIMDVLNSCANICDGLAISEAITAMVEKGLLDEQNIGKPLTQILQKSSEGFDKISYVAKAIKFIIQKNLLNNCPADKLKPIVNSLLAFRSDNLFAREYISESLQIMAEKNILNKLDPADIKQIVDALIDCWQRAECKEQKKCVINAIKAMEDKNLLNQLDTLQLDTLKEITKMEK